MFFRFPQTLKRFSVRFLSPSTLCFMLIVFIGGLISPAGATYQKIRVPYPTSGERELMFFHDDIEVMEDDDGGLILLTTPELTRGLEERGFEVEVLVEDLEAFYTLRARETRDYGVWHTYDEVVAEMAAIHSEYPALSTEPAVIGTSIEGRSIWAMKVSDNPAVDEDEPEILFDGVHHAREVMAMEIPLHFIRYLCENYGSDPVITFIVDNREVWFVPLVNVDGYVYNQTISPNGGGMWRKNRRDNASSSCYGVDPNRNYPYMWGDASTDPCNDTYQGTSPGSEPCVQTMMSFINSHEIVIWQSYHSVVGCVLIPWGYTMAHSPDDATLRAMGEEMSRFNGYEVGQPGEIMYTASGGAFDWGYGATDEHRSMWAFTTEVGGSGFWPEQSEREGLIEENLYSNIYLCLAAGGYAELMSLNVVSAGSDQKLDPGEVAALSVTLRNPGMEIAVSNVFARLYCNDPYIQLTDAVVYVGDIDPNEELTPTTDLFGLEVGSNCPEGRMINFTVVMNADDGIESEKTFSLTAGQLPVIVGCDFESGNDGWTQDSSHNASTGAFSRLDPVGTQFQPEDDTTPDPGIYAWITAQNPGGEIGVNDVDGGTSASHSGAIDLSGVTHATLDLNYFFGQRDAGDDSADSFSLDLSNDNGSSYPVNLVSVGDVNHQANWRHLRVNLDELITLTSTVMLRIQATDAPAAGGDIIEAGLDDIYFYDRGAGNEMPSAPVLVSPLDGASGLSATPTLVVENAIDLDGDDLTYSFRVYADALLTDLVVAVDNVPEGSGGQTSWTVNPPLTAEGTYYWRVCAADPAERGLMMNAAAMTVENLAGLDDLSRSQSTELKIAQNPSRGDVLIRYYTPAEPLSRLEIFDVSGRRVRTIPGARWTEGWQEAAWDGRDDAGESLGDGLYWIRLVLPTESRVVRVMRLK